MKHAPRSALTILFIGILAASTSSIFIRFAQVEVPSIIIASYRLSIATLILLPWSLLRYRSEMTRLTRSQWLQIGAAGFFLGIHFGTWISSLEYTSVTSSVVLVQTTPIFVMLLSHWLLGEKPGGWAYIGLVVAISGSLVIALSESCTLPMDHQCLRALTDLSSTSIKGDLLALTGALSGAAYLLIGRVVRKSIQLLPYITLIYGFAALTLLAIALLYGQSFIGYSPRMYLWFLLLAIFPQLIAHSSYNWALAYLPASSVALSLLGEPISAAFLAYLLLDETIPPLRWIGGLIVLMGIALALYQPRKDLPEAAKIDKMQV